MGLFSVELADAVLRVAGPGALAAVVGLAVAWIVVLRRQVRHQMAVIKGNLQAEAVAEERRRLTWMPLPSIGRSSPGGDSACHARRHMHPPLNRG